MLWLEWSCDRSDVKNCIRENGSPNSIFMECRSFCGCFFARDFLPPTFTGWARMIAASMVWSAVNLPTASGGRDDYA